MTAILTTLSREELIETMRLLHMEAKGAFIDTDGTHYKKAEQFMKELEQPWQPSDSILIPRQEYIEKIKSFGEGMVAALGAWSECLIEKKPVDKPTLPFITRSDYDALSPEQRKDIRYSNPCTTAHNYRGEEVLRVGQVFDGDLGYWKNAHESDF